MGADGSLARHGSLVWRFPGEGLVLESWSVWRETACCSIYIYQRPETRYIHQLIKTTLKVHTMKFSVWTKPAHHTGLKQHEVEKLMTEFKVLIKLSCFCQNTMFKELLFNDWIQSFLLKEWSVQMRVSGGGFVWHLSVWTVFMSSNIHDNHVSLGKAALLSRHFIKPARCFLARGLYLQDITSV